MKVSKGKKIGRTKARISRRNFLLLAGSSAFVLGFGGLSAIGNLQNKRAAASTPQQSVAEVQPFTYLVYTIGSETIAQKFNAGIPSTGDRDSIRSTRPEEVIQSVLNDSGPVDDPNGIRAGPGHVYIHDGLYQLSTAFSGFDLRSYTSLTLGPQAIIRVPNGYTGYVFRLQSKGNAASTSNIMINGGIIHERNPTLGKWIGILLHAIDGGVYFNKFTNINIFNAGTAIELRATSNVISQAGSEQGLGWVNGNSFDSLALSHNNIFIDFVMDGPYESRKNKTGINRNHFANIECQSGTKTTHGIRNIRHFGNSFIGVNIWDIHLGGPSAVASNVHRQATGTLIISGDITGQNFVDRGINTRIIDEQNAEIN